MERTDSAIMLDYLQNNYRPLQPHYRGPLYRSFTPKATVNFAGNPTSAALTLHSHHSRGKSLYLAFPQFYSMTSVELIEALNPETLPTLAAQ